MAVTETGVVIELANGDLAIKLDAPTHYKALLKKQFIVGECVRITVDSDEVHEGVEKFRRFYRAVIVPAFAEYMGEEDPDEAHEALAWKFLRIDDHPTLHTPRRRSTSRSGGMTCEDWSLYIDQCQVLGGKLGVLFRERLPQEKKRGKVA
jgi:hypothetical protein